MQFNKKIGYFEIFECWQLKFRSFLFLTSVFQDSFSLTQFMEKKWNVYCTIQLHHSIYMHATMLPLFLSLSLSIYLPVCLLV